MICHPHQVGPQEIHNGSMSSMATSVLLLLLHCLCLSPPFLQLTERMLLLLLLLLLRSAAAAAASAAPPPDGEALMSFKSFIDPNNHLLFNRSSYHCLWPGITCSPSGRIVRLVLESSALSGPLPSAPLSALSDLRVLSLKSNALTGPIPASLSNLSNLKSLFLSHNLLSGPLPPSLLSLHRLLVLDLSHNLLSGQIPPSIASLPRLSALNLSYNRLAGQIPPLNQTDLKTLDLSNNNLSGAVPVTAALAAFPPAAFAGNPALCGEAVRRECGAHFHFFPIAPSPAVAGGSHQLSGILAAPAASSHKRAVAAIGFLTAGILLILLVAVFLLLKRRRRRRRAPEKSAGSGAVAADYVEMQDEGNVGEVESGGGAVEMGMMPEEKVKRLGKSGCLMFCAGEAPVYTLEQLMRGSAEMLGRGSVGSTYKAVLDNRLIVCVKRLDAAKLGMTGKEAFERHMDAVGRLRHPNLVPLRAYFQAKEERLLVYDYQPNGSLFSLIHGSRSTRAKPLHWTSCLKIAEDVAQGLAYIHQASRLVHGNLKSSNVLLGPDFEACLTDNCLSFLVEPLDSEDALAHRAPEIRKSNRKPTPKSDIYAFGVLLLELLTGSQKPIYPGTDLPAWVRSVRDDEGADDERLTMIIEIAAACVQSSPEGRPMTWQVLKMIQEVKEADIANEDPTSTS